MYLHPVALLSLATFVFAYSIRKSRLVRILKTHSLHSIRARKSQKVACVCDVAFEQYRMFKLPFLLYAVTNAFTPMTSSEAVSRAVESNTLYMYSRACLSETPYLLCDFKPLVRPTGS